MYGDSEFYGDVNAVGYDFFCANATMTGKVTANGDVVLGDINWLYEEGVPTTVEETTTTISGDITIGNEIKSVGDRPQTYRTLTKFNGDTLMKGYAFSNNPTLQINGNLRIATMYDDEEEDFTLECGGATYLIGLRNTFGTDGNERPDSFSSFTHNTFYGCNHFIHGEDVTDKKATTPQKYSIDSYSIYCEKLHACDGAACCGSN